MESVVLLITSLVMISIFFAVANYIAWRLFERPRHALIWSVTFALAALQYGLNLLRGAGLMWETTFWLVANTVSFALVLSALWGHRRRLELVTQRSHMLAVFLLMVAVNATIVLFVELPGPKVAIAPAFACAIMTMITYVLLKHRKGVPLPQNLAASVHFLFGLTQLAAAAIALSFGNAVSAEMQRAYQLSNFALMPSFYVAMGVSVILLLASDLSYRLRVQALTDQLTGLGNRRSFLIAGERIIARIRRSGKPAAMLLCDLDHFKAVNDNYGHSVGDRVLQMVAEVLRKSVRAGEEPGRLGGEEFAIFLEDMTADEAAQVGCRIQALLAKSPVENCQHQLLLTISFGVAQAQEGDTVEGLLQKADQALYQAKNAGRNRVEIYRQGDAGIGLAADAAVLVPVPNESQQAGAQ